MTIPLEPEFGGQSIATSALRNADLIVSTTKAAVSVAIRVATLSEVSHAMLYIGNGQVVEAIGEGVVLRSLGQAVADASLAVSYRHPEMTGLQALLARDFAGQQLDKPYNYGALARQAGVKDARVGAVALSGFAGFKLGCWLTGDVICDRMADRIDPFKKRDEFFCSQLVLAAYKHAGIQLTDRDPVWSSPEDIVSAKVRGHLQYVGHLKA